MSDGFWTSSVDARSGWLTLDDIEKALELYRARAMEPYVEVISLDEWRRRAAERYATCATWLRETADLPRQEYPTAEELEGEK